jgi:hypothetical protein
VIYPNRIRQCLILAVLFPVLVAGCRKEEQAVVKAAQGAAQGAVKAEQQAQANATLIEKQRAALAAISLPTKSLYVDVHDPRAWVNPFLYVGANSMNLRVIMADANPTTMGQGTMLRPEAARRTEIEIRPESLADALTALPPGAWRYGRVVAIAESPVVSPKERPKARRNMEAAIKKLNDLSIVVEEWPAR